MNPRSWFVSTVDTVTYFCPGALSDQNSPTEMMQEEIKPIYPIPGETVLPRVDQASANNWPHFLSGVLAGLSLAASTLKWFMER